MISCANVHYSIKGADLLSDVSLSLEKQKITAILGPNGAGKSTLLKILLGIHIPGQGEVYFDGKTLSDWTNAELAFKRAYMAQAVKVQLNMPVYEYLALSRIHCIESQLVTDRVVEHIIALLGLHDIACENVSTLSGGEWQRVDLARAWCQLFQYSDFTLQPNDNHAYKSSEQVFDDTMLVLDEPGAALDIHQTQRLYDNLTLFTQRGGTVVIVEHDINLAARFCENLVFIKQGRIVKQGASADTFQTKVIQLCFDVQGKVIQDEVRNICSFVL